IVSTVSYMRLARVRAPAITAEVLPPDKKQFNFGNYGNSGGMPALSPDGSTLAFSALDPNGETKLWIRSLEATTTQRLGGTEGGAWPFWSMDGRAIGFFAGGKLKIIDAAGGSPLVLSDVPFGLGGTWNRERTILTASFEGLSRVADSGGTSIP